MKKRYHSIWFGTILILLVSLLYYISYGFAPMIDEYTSIQKNPVISPDYTDTVIPPNIAPLNFMVKEDGNQYCAKIYSVNGAGIDVSSKTGRIVIPIGPWKKLLNANRGEKLYFDIYVKDKTERWIRFHTITNRIADEDIDNFLVYRKIHPSHSRWGRMGVYQRNLENYDESIVLTNMSFAKGCVNCHTFMGNSTDKMLLDIRSKKYGTSALLVVDGVVEKLGVKLGFTSWHPSGRVVACSINKPYLFFHSARNYVQDIVELDSALVYYLVDSKTLKTSPKISRKDRLETFPTWSPDGRNLYFCSAPMLWSSQSQIPPDRYNEVRYDLMRVSYDLDNDQWGEPGTVLSSQDTGLSILQPRISPDGRWLLSCMCDYGTWAVHNPGSDLYITDLKAAKKMGKYEYRRLDINSNQSESWHSWSSNSRWIVFSSKRQYSVFTRSYISYVDETGKVYKPLLLPQKNPSFYDSCLETYTIPEFVTQPVQVTEKKLDRVIRGSRKIPTDMPITMATPSAEQVTSYENQLQERE
jgi:Tol biopolymer transport system component